MARRQVTNSRFKRDKKPRISKLVQVAHDLQYMGPEPTYNKDVVLDGAALTTVYCWYNYMCASKEAREYLEDHFKISNDKDGLKALKKLPDSKISLTSAWLCRMLAQGALLSPRSMTFLESRLQAIMDYVPRDQDETQTVSTDDVEETPKEVDPSKDIQAKTRERRYDIIGDIEHLIDTVPEFSMYEYLVKNSIPPMHVKAIAEFYQKQVVEFDEALLGKDPDLKEGYKSFGKKGLKALRDKYDILVDDCNRHVGNLKKDRAPRTPKPVPVDKVLKTFRYQKDSAEHKLVSVDPRNIIGTGELWVFSTKYKIITVFRAKDRAGLSVKGASITGFDEQTSKAYSTGRKPEELVQKVLNAGKVGLRDFGEGAKENSYFTSRINENTILLRTVKLIQ